jgi:tRNA G10  N-methylase Trm11
MRNEPLTWDVILRLRNNIELESDLQLAEMEVACLFDTKPQSLDRYQFESLCKQIYPCDSDIRYCRQGNIVAYKLSVNKFNALKVFRCLSFVDLLIGFTTYNTHTDRQGREFLKDVPHTFWRMGRSADKLFFRLVPINSVAEWSDIAVKQASGPDSAVNILQSVIEGVLDGRYAGHLSKDNEKLLTARVTTGHLFHALHVYKAKFFPRMVRAMLNIFGTGAGAMVLDPFVGSGTTLTEASLLGMPSFGTDVDPLSILIASAKINLLRSDAPCLREKVEIVKEYITTQRSKQLSLFHLFEKRIPYATLPTFIETRIPDEIRQEITEDVILAHSAINLVTGSSDVALRVALSDAISRKIKFRFLGLGYGRFSLTVMPTRIIDMFYSNLDYLVKSAHVWDWLRKTAGLRLPPSSVQMGDARRLPFDASTFDLVVTSPPYMPASSGRENYLQSKAPAMIALGVIDEQAIGTLEHFQVGSVHRKDDLNGLPPKARELVAWMMRDEVRHVKAPATAAYFIDLAQALGEIHRVLKPGGRCAMVVARQHTFYKYRSREVVRMVDNASIVSELAEVNGFNVEKMVHVELKKQNSIARPRSQDAYYETIIVMNKQ